MQITGPGRKIRGEKARAAATDDVSRGGRPIERGHDRGQSPNCKYNPATASTRWLTPAPIACKNVTHACKNDHSRLQNWPITLDKVRSPPA